MLAELVEVTYLAAATSTVSMTLTKAKVSRPLRVWISSRSKFMGELINCPYCTSHWVAALICAIYRPRPFPLVRFIDWFIATAVIIMIATVFNKILFECQIMIMPKIGEHREEIKAVPNQAD